MLHVCLWGIVWWINLVEARLIAHCVLSSHEDLNNILGLLPLRKNTIIEMVSFKQISTIIPTSIDAKILLSKNKLIQGQIIRVQHSPTKPQNKQN
ncbi:hypothetical protein VNO78_01277 [Psophocarpus tetragonolobus]|uniref:Uncharacterized protein n=1 Tax=Psophocarpus tetragonolobus TaxID=3891 RepID=A0AAN9XVG2_PSOTE